MTGIDFVFFQNLQVYFNGQVQLLADAGFLRLLTLVLGVLQPIVVVWITWQGYLIATGRSQNNISNFVFDFARIGVVLIIAQSLVQQNNNVRQLMDGFASELVTYLTGQAKTTIYAQIDGALLTMQTSINALNSDIPIEQLGLNQMSSSAWMSAVGQGGPILVLGALLFTCKLALMLAIILSPIFVLCLLFKTTQTFFWSWVRYVFGIVLAWSILLVFGTMVLSIMDMYAQSVLNAYNNATQVSADAHSLINSAVLQCLLGMLLMILLVSVPKVVLGLFNTAILPIVNHFTQGTSVPSITMLQTSLASTSNTASVISSPPHNTVVGASGMSSNVLRYTTPSATQTIKLTVNHGKRSHDKLNLAPRNRHIIKSKLSPKKAGIEDIKNTKKLSDEKNTEPQS